MSSVERPSYRGGNITDLPGGYDEFQELPPSGTVFVLAMLAPHQRRIARRLTQTWALNSHGQVHRQCHEGESSHCSVWEVTEQFEQKLENHTPAGPQLPCGHHGFRNLGDGRYTCAADFCDSICSRDELKEAMGHE